MEQINAWSVETGGDIFDYPGPGKSPAWTYFGFHKSIDGSLNKNKAVCKICRSYVKNCGNTSNLRAHLSSHHGLVFSGLKTETMHFGNVNMNGEHTMPSEFPKMTAGRFNGPTSDEHDGEAYKRIDNFTTPCKMIQSNSDTTSKNEVIFDIAASLTQCQTLKFDRDPKETRKSNQTYDSSKQIFDNPSNFKSPVWNYFGFHMSENGSLDRSETVCKLCFVKIKYCNTTNLRNHLTKHHGIQFANESPNSNSDREYFPGGSSCTNTTTTKSVELESFSLATNFTPKIAFVSEEKSIDEIPKPIFENPVRFKSPVWSYFGFHMSDDDGTLDKTRAICRLCSGTVKFSGNTTNLRVHLANHHDINVGNADKSSSRSSLESSSWNQESNSSFSEGLDVQNEADKPETDVSYATRPSIVNKKVWNNFNFSITDEGSIDKTAASCRICNESVAYDGAMDKLRRHLNKHYISGTPNNKMTPSLSRQEDISLENSSSDSIVDIMEMELDEITDTGNLYEYPGKAKSAVWKDFGFLMSEDGSLDKSKAVCRLCHKAIKFCGNTTNLQYHLTKLHRKATEEIYSQNSVLQIEEIFSNGEKNNLDISSDPSTDCAMEPRSDVRVRQIFEYPGKYKSSVWKDFGFYMADDGTLDKSRAVCRLCLTTIKYCGNTTNLHSHLTKHHGYIAVFGETVVRRNEHDSDLLNRSQIMPFNVNHVQNLNTAIVEFLIGTLSPIPIVETPAFKKLMMIMDPSYSIPSCHYFSDTLISEMYSFSSSRMQEILERSEAIAITTDFWKSISEKCYMTVSANIITHLWEQENFVLQTCELGRDYTAKTIVNELRNVAVKWKLRGSLILISGSPSHMKDVGTELQWLNLNCFGHTINFSAKSGLELAQVVKIVESVRKIFTFFKQNEAAKSVLQEKRCLLQLPDNDLLHDSRSHWKSTYDMIDRLVEQSVAILAALSEQDLKKHSSIYDSNLQSQAEEIITVFKPLKTAATLICEQKMPIASMILPILRKLEMMLICMEDDTSLARDTRLTIWENLFQQYKETDIRDFLLVTSLLDPRYKDLRFVDPPEREHAKNVLQTIAMSKHLIDIGKNDIKMEINQSNCSVEESPFSASTAQQPLRKKIKLEKGLEPTVTENMGTDDWLADVVSEKDESTKILKTPVTVEVDRYLSEMQTTMNPLQWWQDRQLIYPHLCRIAKKYLCVPVTAVPSERIFNVTENVFLQQAILPAENVDKMLFLHYNYEKLKK